MYFSAGDSFKSLEDDAAPKEGGGGGGNGTKDGVGGTSLKDNENNGTTVEKESPTINVPSTAANAETPTKSSKLSIFGSKDKKDKADKNASDKDNSSKMPLGLGGKPKGATSDGYDGKCQFCNNSSPFRGIPRVCHKPGHIKMIR